MPGRRGSIVLAGCVAQRPYRAGHTWVFLQYLIGFRQLGFDVLLLDRLDAGMCVDANGAPCKAEDSVNVQYLRDVLEQFDLHHDFSIACDGGSTFIGLPRQEVLSRVRDADMLINFNGYLDSAEVLGAARRRVFFDIDPGVLQMWRELGWHDPFHGYDAYATFGERIGQPDCTVPTCGIDWVRTRPPVVLDQWPVAPPTPDGLFTSIGAWRGPYAPIEFNGVTYGLRVHEFRKFVALPSLTSERFELALDIDAAETRDLELLSRHAWRLTDPTQAAHDPDAYRRYIGGSKAEFLVAKNMPVQTRSGWFSDRSACYLASGKPVLMQDTTLADLYPVGLGLLTFSTLEEARAGVGEIAGNYERHCQAARNIAEDYFDSAKVLSRLLDGIGA